MSDQRHSVQALREEIARATAGHTFTEADLTAPLAEMRWLVLAVALADAIEREGPVRRVAALMAMELGRIPDPRFADLRPVDVRSLVVPKGGASFQGAAVALTDEQIDDAIAALLRAAPDETQPEPLP